MTSPPPSEAAPAERPEQCCAADTQHGASPYAVETVETVAEQSSPHTVTPSSTPTSQPARRTLHIPIPPSREPPRKQIKPPLTPPPPDESMEPVHYTGPPRTREEIREMTRETIRQIRARRAAVSASLSRRHGEDQEETMETTTQFRGRRGATSASRARRRRRRGP